MADPDDTGIPTEPEAPDDVRSALVAALEESEADAGQQQRQPKETAADPAADGAEKPAERARGPDGKFIRTEAEDAAEAAKKPAAAPTDRTPRTESTPKPGTEGEQPAGTGTGKEPPSNWTVADQQLFKGLPVPAQEFLLRRHNDMTADYTRKTQELAGFRNAYEPIAQLLAPHAEQMQQKGLTPATLFQSWYNVEKRLLDGDGANVVAGLVQGYRIPVEAIARALGIQASTAQPGNGAGTGQPGAAGQPPPMAQPQVQLPPELIQTLSAHNQWIQAEQQRQQQHAQMQHQEAASRVMSDIDQFAAATDKAGAPAHPFFRDVEEDMTRLVLAARARGGPLPSLSDLYDQAVWANPSTRAAMLANERAAAEAQRATDEQKRKAEARARAEQSRRAGSSINGSPGNNSQVPGRQRGNGSVRDDIAAAMEDIEA